MLISAIGTQCIGKSTFIKDFIKECPKFITPSIDYRTIIEKNKLSLNRDGNYRSQKCLFDFMKDQICELSTHKDKFYILDRSLVDVLAYSYWLYDNKDDVIFSHDNLEQLESMLIEHVKLYDYLIYIPLSTCKDVIIVDDKFRDTNAEYRQEIDVNFKHILNTISKFLPPIITVHGTREERITMLKNSIPSLF